MLDAKSERAIAQIAEGVRLVFGSDLVSLVLYGSAAGDDFTPGRSDLNLAIVLERLTFRHLKALHEHLPRWRKLGTALPLLLDRRFLERSRDVFPMEFSDIKAQHRVLYGEEVFATLAIDTRHLRYQFEHEARSKLLRLQALYAEVGADRRRLEDLMLDSMKTFVLLMHHVLRLEGQDAPIRRTEIIEQCERHFDLAFPTMRYLVQVRSQNEPWAGSVDDTFTAYLDEVESLIDLIDRLNPMPATAAEPEAGR